MFSFHLSLTTKLISLLSVPISNTYSISKEENSAPPRLTINKMDSLNMLQSKQYRYCWSNTNRNPLILHNAIHRQPQGTPALLQGVHQLHGLVIESWRFIFKWKSLSRSVFGHCYWFPQMKKMRGSSLLTSGRRNKLIQHVWQGLANLRNTKVGKDL